MKKMFEKIISFFTFGREGLWERLESGAAVEEYTVAMFHNGRRPIYQILRLDGKKWKIVGPAMPSAAWAQELIKKYKKDGSLAK